MTGRQLSLTGADFPLVACFDTLLMRFTINAIVRGMVVYFKRGRVPPTFHASGIGLYARHRAPGL